MTNITAVGDGRQQPLLRVGVVQGLQQAGGQHAAGEQGPADGKATR